MLSSCREGCRQESLLFLVGMQASLIVRVGRESLAETGFAFVRPGECRKIVLCCVDLLDVRYAAGRRAGPSRRVVWLQAEWTARYG